MSVWPLFCIAFCYHSSTIFLEIWNDNFFCLVSFGQDCGSQDLYWLHVNIRDFFSTSIKDDVGMLIVVTLNP